MSAEYSYLLASNLEKTLSYLREKYINIETKQISPPHNKTGIGKKRVIKIKEITPEKIMVIWSYENYN